MSMLTKSRKMRIAGIFFLAMQALIMYANYRASRFDGLFWFCNHTPLLIGISFLIGRKDFIKAIINVGFLPQLIWTVDFLGRLFFGTCLFDVTQYVFEGLNGRDVLVAIITHMFAINIALFLTRKQKINKKVLLYSAVYLVSLLVVSFIYSPVDKNVNFIKYFGAPAYTFPGYTALWAVLAFVIVVVPTYFIQKGIYKISTRKNE